MNLKVKKFNLKAGKPIAFLHEKDAKRINLNLSERIEISHNSHKITAIVDIVKGFIHSGEIALSEQVMDYLKLKSGETVSVDLSEKPAGSRIIGGKAKCESYTKKELIKIMKDIVNNNLSEAEIAYFISGVNYCGMSLKETVYLTEAVVKTGKVISWKEKKIADKHSIGGVPGNRTTPIVVSICASAGIIMPKTSSRAITSAAGTADAIETLAKVDFSIQKLRKIVKKTNACLVWGGSLGLAPADDKLIQVEKILNLDPEPQLIASILAKKISVGSNYVLIDIPYGNGAKVSKAHAEKLKSNFEKIARKLNLKVKVLLTDGSQPVGNGIGPALEMRDVLKVLRRDNPPKDLEERALQLASCLLEFTGKVGKGNGMKKAKEILDSGQALKKFEEIIHEQGGNLELRGSAKYKQNINSSKSGKIKNIDNKKISYTARLAGCPAEKFAGIYLHHHNNEKIKKNQTLVTIYSNSKSKLNDSVEFFNKFKPITIA